MSRYIEVEGHPGDGEPKVGIPLPRPIKETELVSGQVILLIDPKHVDIDSGESVTVTILPNGERAKVLVKTTGCCFRPGMVVDREKGGVWFGAELAPCESVHTPKHVWTGRVEDQRRQRTLTVERQTIIANSLRRVEWREGTK